MSRKLNIIVTFDVYTDEAPGDTAVADRLHLSMPPMSAKFVQFPKLVEGMTERLVEHHNNKVSAWETQKAREEAERRKRPTLWDATPEKEDRLYQEGVQLLNELETANQTATDDTPVIDGAALLAGELQISVPAAEEAQHVTR